MGDSDVSPHASEYQSDPWVPNVDPDASDHEDQEDAAETYSEIYGVTPTSDPTDDSDDEEPPDEMVTMPTLSMAYTTAPDLVPTEPGGGSGSTAMPTLPDSNAFSIDLGALRTTEQTFLGVVANVTSAYETLRAKVQGAIDDPTLFGQDNGHWENWGRAGLHWVEDELAESGVQFAEAINPQLTKVMQDGAGGIELMGTFTALLNNAGQTYAQADSKSSMPDVGPRAQAMVMEPDPQSPSAV
ncbi:hypothetical protein ACFYXS_17325 [Streptomyces sp. NPDC002574]|uniref:hypothetical protein n=1 Tax=Streptomyces sp. NPDC002574 TaxID=3364652 RepID=UPI0036CF2C26